MTFNGSRRARCPFRALSNLSGYIPAASSKRKAVTVVRGAFFFQNENRSPESISSSIIPQGIAVPRTLIRTDLRADEFRSKQRRPSSKDMNLPDHGVLLRDRGVADGEKSAQRGSLLRYQLEPAAAFFCVADIERSRILFL